MPVARDDTDYAQADPAGATGEPGAGKVTRSFVVRLTKETQVYRLWAGPDVRDARGNTSRLGSWWTFDRPSGSLSAYRRRYEVCESWNSLRWVAECTLRAGAVVVMGGGQSVSALTCGDATGREHYPANDRDLQVYIREAFKRVAPPAADLSCPDESRDYPERPAGRREAGRNPLAHNGNDDTAGNDEGAAEQNAAARRLMKCQPRNELRRHKEEDHVEAERSAEVPSRPVHDIAIDKQRAAAADEQQQSEKERGGVAASTHQRVAAGFEHGGEQEQQHVGIYWRPGAAPGAGAGLIRP